MTSRDSVRHSWRASANCLWPNILGDQAAEAFTVEGEFVALGVVVGGGVV